MSFSVESTCLDTLWDQKKKQYRFVILELKKIYLDFHEKYRISFKVLSKMLFIIYLS